MDAEHLKRILIVDDESDVTELLDYKFKQAGYAIRTLNDPLRATSTVVFAPGATGNNYVDPATGQTGTQWAFNTAMNAAPFWTGARGFRGALAYQKDLGRLGRHQASVFARVFGAMVQLLRLFSYFGPVLQS